jgi:hypothetical protein
LRIRFHTACIKADVNRRTMASVGMDYLRNSINF